jgi:serine protease Do
MARKVVAQLKEKGKVVRGRLGVTMQNVNEGMRRQLGIKSEKGAIVTTVEPDGPADKAGFKQYDVIIELNGQPVEDSNDLKFKIADIEPGKKISVKVVREGREIVLSPVVEELEPEEEKGQVASSDKDVGLTLTPMTPALARRYGYRTTEGLLVTEVRDYSEADKAGIGTGDIILEVNRVKVATVREFESILKKTAEGDEVVLLVRREGDGQSQDYILTLKVSS